MDNFDPFFVDAIWLSIAFAGGLLAKRIGLPPLVGFLLGGFIINFSGFHQGQIYSAVEAMSDIGVMLLLFTIGLKLKLKTLFKKEIWATATIHIVLTILALSGVFTLLTFSGLQLFTGLTFTSSLMISFALSFSSTVFVVKSLESRGEFESYHGKLAIGILIIQDIFAVLFITFSDNKLPSLWVFTLPILLWVLKKLLSKILNTLEHGEMIPVFGFFATFIAGAFSFSFFGLKPDLGALIIGMLLVNHPRVDELYKRMVEYKDFFLIAFFINVGLIGLPSSSTVLTAIILLPLVVFKGVLFLLILSRFQLQPRTAFLGALSLSNFSEFGLIVGVVGLNIGLINEEWLVALALLMAFSFAISAPLSNYSHVIFDKFKFWILKINQNTKGEDCEPVDFGNAEYLVIGLGSVGKPAYDTLQTEYGQKVLGLDYNTELIEQLGQKRSNVKWADSTDSELWDKVDSSKLKAVFLTMSEEETNLNILKAINRINNRSFKIFTICHYPDQKVKYLNEGAHFVFDYKNYLGKDYVEQSLNQL
ncbi:potassium transporter Kef [Cyclobacteriaceae bacterium YHN15]|nr:potassium transporter Kef [Cyclobacteriaceae bacterium YHN15]